MGKFDGRVAIITGGGKGGGIGYGLSTAFAKEGRSEEHTSELQSH